VIQTLRDVHSKLTKRLGREPDQRAWKILDDYQVIQYALEDVQDGAITEDEAITRLASEVRRLEKLIATSFSRPPPKREVG
jgi:hypothetical protein